jgi:hypothetical protein
VTYARGEQQTDGYRGSRGRSRQESLQLGRFRWPGTGCASPANETIAAFARQWSSCVVAIEACCRALHLRLQLASHGHEVRLMSPEYVRPYVDSQRNDDRDAEAIAEAATRPTMRFITVKSAAQSDMQSLHWAGGRTHRARQQRAVLLEQCASGEGRGWDDVQAAFACRSSRANFVGTDMRIRVQFFGSLLIAVT